MLTGWAERESTMLRQLPIAIFLLAFLGSFVAAQPRGTLDLTRLKSRHYEIVTDLPRDEAMAYGRHMDIVFAEFTSRLRGFGVRNATPMTLYLMSDQVAYMNLLAGFGINGTNSGGMFFWGGDASGLATFVRGRDRATVLATLQHEGFHQFAYLRISDRLPIWVNEGLAEWFGEALIVRGKLRLGLAPSSRVSALRTAHDRRDLMTLEDFLTMTSREWSNNLRSGSPRGWTQYDQAWSVVHFLIDADDGRYAGMLLDYLKACQQGLDTDQAIERAFKSRDLTQFEKRYLDWLTSDLKPDPISTANEQLEILSDAIAELHRRGLRPASLEEFRDLTLRSSLAATRFEHGQRRDIPIDDRWFVPPPPDRPNATTSLVFEPGVDDGLPTLRIEGLRVSVRLAWDSVMAVPVPRVVLD